jgi:hypothetical protein
MMVAEHDSGTKVMDLRVFISVASLLLGASACTTSTEYRAREDAELARFERHAGAPVERINTYTGLDRWQSLAADKLVIWTSVNRVFLLTLRAPCSGLDFQQAIAITSSNNIIDRRFDRVQVDGLSCYISEIRPIDYKALMQEERAEHRDR